MTARWDSCCDLWVLELPDYDGATQADPDQGFLSIVSDYLFLMHGIDPSQVRITVSFPWEDS